MMTMMKALVKKEPGPGAEFTEVPKPTIGPKDVLIKVKTASICGTDNHIYSWDAWAQKRINPPIVFGHELAGKIVEVGCDVEKINVGDFVSAETHIVCGKCFQCLNGNAHVCRNVKILGVDVDGAFAEYVKIPEMNAWKTSTEIPHEIASVQEPLGNAVHATLIEPVTDKTVLVLGCGPIGLMSIAVAKASGASLVLAADINEYRIDLAKKMGADIAIKAPQEDLIERVMKETNGEGVDVTLEMAGSPATVQESFRALKRGGRVSLLGIPSKPIELDIPQDIVFRGARVYGICGRKMFETWETVRSLLESGRLDISPIITHTFKLEEFEKAFALSGSRMCGKIILNV